MPPSFSARYDLPFVALISMIAVAAVSLEVWADEPSAEPRRVAMAADLQAFSHQPLSDDSAQRLRSAIRRGAEEQWRQDGVVDIQLLGDEDLREAVTGHSLYDGTLELAREWGEMGIESYNQVRTREAVDYLERSLQNFHQISHHLVAPEEISKIKMYLALSYLEDGIDVVRPLEVFQQMIRRNPARQMETGYYPDFIVQYYENARQSLWNRLRQEGPPAEESRQIAELVDADFVFHAYAVPRSEEAVELVAYLYDVAEAEFLPAERLVIEDVDEDSLQEGFDRLASRLAVCLVETQFDDDPGDSELTASTGTSRLSVELGLNYGSFLQVPSPILEPFGNYGLGLAAGWSVTREFQVVGSLHVTNSMRDYSGILRDNFTTVRGMIGGELGREVGPIYLGVSAGIEATRFSTIRAFTDRSCIPDPGRLCPGDADTEVFDDLGIHWGMNIGPRVGWRLSDSLEVISSLDISYYFSPLEDRLLNFPVTTELGIRYRF